MSKTEFLSQLRSRLAQLPPEEREKHIAYYEELLNDMLEDGMSETEATARLGDPAQIAAELLAELPLGTLVKQRVRPRNGWTALNVALLVLGAPLWLPLLLTLLAVVLALVITLWSLGISLGAAVLALGATAGAMLGGAIFGYLAASPLLLTGLGLIFCGLFLLGLLLLRPLFAGLTQLLAWLYKQGKILLIGRAAP